jgi:hypothetical protein
MIYTAAVEGPSDEAALHKIVASTGDELGQVHGRNGKTQILRNLAGYNYAARFEPWIVLIDLDKEACAVTSKSAWLTAPAELMCLRIAVRELEAWLLADRERFSSYFAVSIDLIPSAPDDLPDPKLTLINIIRRSRRRAIRQDMLPDPQLGQSIGPAYTSRIIEYISSDDGWRVEIAAIHSDSLRRAVESIAQLRELVDRSVD